MVRRVIKLSTRYSLGKTLGKQVARIPGNPRENTNVFENRAQYVNYTRDESHISHLQSG